MLESYKARRAMKHAAEKAGKQEAAQGAINHVLDLVSPVPRLAFLGAKQYRQSGQQRKNWPKHNTEWNEALVENGSRTFAAGVAKAVADEPLLEIINPDPGNIIHGL